MKKLAYLLAVPVLLGASLTGNASDKVSLFGVEYQVDTVSHLKVGPGTTTTHLRLTGPSLIQAHYLTIDRTQPDVTFHAVCGTDNLAGCERTSNMAKRKSTPNRLYYAGTNADFFVTAGNATNGSSKVGTPIASCVVDGETYSTSAWSSQFTVDKDGLAFVGFLDYSSGTATMGDKTTSFKGVNVDSPANGITLYTTRYYGSTNQTDKAGACAEVAARLVEGDLFACGGEYRLEIVGEPTSTGDAVIPEGQFVIHGRGSTSLGNTGAQEFVQNLKPGDVVTFHSVVKWNGQSLQPLQVVSGNIQNLINNVTVDYPNPDLHPRTGVGISADGNTIILMVVEGRYSGSAGIRIDAFGDLLRYAGAYNGINLDGGGSSTLYTSAFGIRNFCSDGYERSVSNGIFVAVDLPDEVDNTITEVRFADWHVRMPQYGRYTPRLIGYNRHGLVVNDSITDYTLSCPPELGEIRNGVTMLATGGGTYALTADVNGVKTSVPVTVDNNVEFSTRIADLLIDNRREYAVELVASDGIKTMNVAPEALSWSSSDAAVATVNEDGVVKGVGNGSAVISGSVGEKHVSINVTVEIAPAPKMNILADYDASKWKFTKSGCGSATVVEVAGTGVEIPYAVTSSRSASITITPSTQLPFWSIPGSLELNLTAEGTSIPSGTLKLITANGIRLSVTLPEIEANQATTIPVNLSELVDTDDMLIYPIKLMSLSFTLQAKSGTQGKLVFPEFNAVYGNEGGVGEILDDATVTVDGETEYYNLQGIRVINPSAGVFIKKCGNKAEKVIIW